LRKEDSIKSEELIAAWIRYHQQSKPQNDDPDFAAWEKLNDLIHERPSQAFNLVEQIISKTEDKRVLGSMGAGPLEDLLVSHGEQFVDKVLDNARQDEKWRFVLGCVWINSANNATVKDKISNAIKRYFPNGTP